MEIQQFHIIGINYKKTDAAIRGHFAIGSGQYSNLLKRAAEMDLNNVFVLSTCNRTEIYGVAPSREQLSDLLVSESNGDKATFDRLCYHSQGEQAVEHLFTVASGIDSQILGDYEIVGQLKLAVKFAKEHGTISSFIERLTNTVFQSSKAIKNQTLLSGGTVSVAFAAIQFLKIHCSDIANLKIVILGAGKIGKNTCKNLIDYLGAKDITIINRSEDKAISFAQELGLKTAPFDKYLQYVNEADVVIVATNASSPILFAKDLISVKKRVFIDLSIPNNIDIQVKQHAGAILVNVDDLSKMNDETLQMRKAEVPKARTILDLYIAEFYDWYKMRKNVPIIQAAKKTLSAIQLCPWFQGLNAEQKLEKDLLNDAVQNAVKKLAVKMRHETTPGCTYIEALNDFIAHSPIKS